MRYDINLSNHHHLFCERTETIIDYEDDKLFEKIRKHFYKKELRKYPHPRSLKNIDALETYRGGMCGAQKAEAFDVIKILD